ncbi:hypothetical protein LINPERPRIM_LOCUS34207 [Linum perenne]
MIGSIDCMHLGVEKLSNCVGGPIHRLQKEAHHRP